MKLSPVAVCLLMSMACTIGQPVAPASPISVTKDNVFKFYNDFKRLTKKPEFLDPDMTDLCRPTYPPATQERAKAHLGPHYRALVHYYANPTAATALSKELKILPEGSVFVKEKLSANWEVPAKAPVVSGVGGMIKRAAGFDAEHGDWEYFYSDKQGGFTIGKIKNCAECHATVKAKDHVFRVRRPFE
jgi:hypothetical protein